MVNKYRSLYIFVTIPSIFDLPDILISVSGECWLRYTGKPSTLRKIKKNAAIIVVFRAEKFAFYANTCQLWQQ